MDTLKPSVSEEINDILDKMPTSFGRWIALFVFVFFLLLFVFGWMIKYPDIVSGPIKITSSNAPVKLVANISGNIQEISFSPQSEVKKGDYVAIIKNSANTDDIKLVLRLVQGFDLNNDSLLCDVACFPERVFLGDVNVVYHTFISALKDRAMYEQGNAYDEQRAAFYLDIEGKEKIKTEIVELSDITERKLEIRKRWFDKYDFLHKKDTIMSGYDVDQKRDDYLTIKQELTTLRKELILVNMQIAEIRNKLIQLDIEQKERESALHLGLISSYHALCDHLKQWEYKYVFVAPFDGKVEFLNFLVEDQYVQSGELLFGIVPKENAIVAHMFLPSSGAGKVRVGNRVSIKLDNYPYLEFGSVEGFIESISLITQTQRTETNPVETYLVRIELPNKLLTNYGESLGFKYEINGVADIAVKERRLIERLFDNLKYKTK